MPRSRHTALFTTTYKFWYFKNRLVFITLSSLIIITLSSLIMNEENRADFSSVPILPGYESLEKFVQSELKTVIEATKNANKLPCGQSRDFYETCPSFHRIMKDQGHAVLSQLSRVLKHAGCKGNIQRRDEEERLEMIVEANDAIFERVGTLLDDIAGIRRNPNAELLSTASKPISGAWNRRSLDNSRAPQKISPVVTAMLQSSKNMEKPQLNFVPKIDNARDSPFIPKITFKHNLLQPLAILYEVEESGGQYSHPYEFEIDKFTPDENLLKEVKPEMYPTLDKTPLMHVTSADQVEEMLQCLRKANAIAVDLEHHSYRCFQGFTCLMQISTREADFIVDTIALREELQPLNEVFTDPKVLKVLHGAQMDIQWLQRDLGLYIVNLFDTHIAGRHLSFSSLSLAYLLNRFCGVQAQKQFQLADWRIRPLPAEMVQYAREDTHYLLYISDLLRNMLLQQANAKDNLLRSVFSEGKQLCMTRYVKPLWHPDDHQHLYHKSKRLFNNRQLFALQQLFDWRDRTARECDESIGYVLPNHMLLHIADTLPREVQGILACCNPVPPLVRQNLTALHYLVRRAREQPLIQPVQDTARKVHHTDTYSLTVDSPLLCPHDTSWLPDFRSDLPVLLDSSEAEEIRKMNGLALERPTISVFESVTSSCKKGGNESILTPYQRYKLVKPFADAVAKDVTEELEANKQTVEKLAIDGVKKTIKKEIVEPEELLPLREQLRPNERKKKKDKHLIGVNHDVPEQPSEKKAKSVDPFEADSKATIKKMKKSAKDGGETTILPNPYHEITSAQPVEEVLATKLPCEVPPRLKEKRKKKLQPSEKMANFDYSSVDFRKFQSNSADKVVHKDRKNKIKHKRMSKKKIKVAI